jgi:outer membrane protein
MGVVALFLAFGSSASAADLLDVYRQARGADATYAAARATWAAAQERIPQGRAGLLPLASISASVRYNDRGTRFSDDTTPRTSSDFGSGELSLSVTQPLYRKQNVIAYEQAFTQAEQADAQLALAAQDLILRVAQAYFDVLLAQDNVAFAQAQKTAIGQQLEQAKRNFDVGTATITDTHEAQARFDLTTAQEIAARNDLELRRRALEQLIAQPAPPIAPLGRRFVLRAPQPARMDDWVAQATNANLQVRVANSALTFSSQEITRNRAAHLPTLDVFATLSGSNTETGTTTSLRSETRGSVIGVQLAIPLYQGGAISSRVRESVAQESRAREELESARRTAQFNARQAYLGITSGVSQVNALEAALVSTQSQLDSTRVGRDVGVRTQVDVLNAQQLLFSASRDLAQSKYNYVMSLLRLEAAVGELTEEDIAALNQWLDREAAKSAEPPASDPVVFAVKEPVKPEAASPLAPSDDSAAVHSVLDAWARAWSSNDVAGYLSHYAPGFEPPRGVTRSAWEAERRSRIQAPRQIEVALESRAISFEASERARVTFRQRYRSGSLNVTSDKAVIMVKEGNRWLIRQERIEAESVERAEARPSRSSVQTDASALAR